MKIRYENVCIESFGYTLPQDIWTSAQIEDKLAPLYRRLKLPEGRLGMMTGIQERRFWPKNLRPSELSVNSGRLALEVADWDPSRVGCLIHGSVCRDFLEPATSCTVHHQLGLGQDCVIYDVSNACLGIMNGMVQAANMIELGQIESALVVGSEGGRQLVETTIDALNRDESLTRKSIKSAVASLTIGSASCAVLLTHRSVSSTGNRMLVACCKANTQYNELCQSLQDQAGRDMAPLMETDSEELMKRGIETGVETMAEFLEETGWSPADIARSVCHQVGGTHRKLMLEALGIAEPRDYATYSWLGNTGSAALPVTMAIACENEFILPGEQVGMFGIGSGINCVMIAAQWQKSLVRGMTWKSKPANILPR
ncbi:MAG: 3-oxoacyl-ACP synthase III [Planctomycetota bacterium]|nr:3-oxoacyl-ACP synthase III [Planctomycetota bacterium]